MQLDVNYVHYFLVESILNTQRTTMYTWNNYVQMAKFCNQSTGKVLTSLINTLKNSIPLNAIVIAIRPLVKTFRAQITSRASKNSKNQ